MIWKQCDAFRAQECRECVCASARGSAPLADVSDGEHDAQGGEHNVPGSELRCVEEIAGEDAHDVLPGALVLVHSLADGPASSLGRTREPIPTGVHELTFSLNQ